MRGINEYYPTLVLSNHGITDIRDLHLHDWVYEYRTGQRLPVLGMKETPIEDMVRVTMSDGRHIDVGMSDMIYIGDDKIVPITDVINNSSLCTGIIHQYSINYNIRQYRQYDELPAYLAGALLINGEFDSEYVTLHTDSKSTFSLFDYMLDIQASKVAGYDYVTFNLNGQYPYIKVKWRHLFGPDKIFPITHNPNDKLIPDRYMYASRDERGMFIRGAFDGGFNHDMFKDNIAIASKSEGVLKWLQPMLWSSGILSTISYDPDIPGASGRVYRLDVVGAYANDPGMFYSVKFIERAIENRNDKSDTEFKVQIVKLERIKPGWRDRIILEKPSLILTHNHLPIMTL